MERLPAGLRWDGDSVVDIDGFWVGVVEAPARNFDTGWRTHCESVERQNTGRYQTREAARAALAEHLHHIQCDQRWARPPKGDTNAE